jgi:hypothetical protein
VLPCVGTGFSDGIIKGPAESYRVSNCLWLRNVSAEESSLDVGRHHQGWRQYAPLKRRSTIILHGSTSQKTILNTMSERCSQTVLKQNPAFDFRHSVKRHIVITT